MIMEAHLYKSCKSEVSNMSNLVNFKQLELFLVIKELPSFQVSNPNSEAPKADA